MSRRPAAMLLARNCIGPRRATLIPAAALLWCCAVAIAAPPVDRRDAQPDTAPPPVKAVFFRTGDAVPGQASLVVIEAHARYLIQHPAATLRLEGHADERGSREYNLGRGQHRADEVKRRLISLGAQASQIVAISLGEERPLDRAHTTSAWARNRRVAFVYPEATPGDDVR